MSSPIHRWEQITIPGCRAVRVRWARAKGQTPDGRCICMEFERPTEPGEEGHPAGSTISKLLLSTEASRALVELLSIIMHPEYLGDDLPPVSGPA